MKLGIGLPDARSTAISQLAKKASATVHLVEKFCESAFTTEHHCERPFRLNDPNPPKRDTPHLRKVLLPSFSYQSVNFSRSSGFSITRTDDCSRRPNAWSK
jgi:hypothetical protein